jgi:YVTN family beta-propeller protein
LQDPIWFEAQTRRYGFRATDVFSGNPPSAALVMAPVAFMTPNRARVVWTWFSVICWIGGVLLLGMTTVFPTNSRTTPQTGCALRADGSMWIAVPGLLLLAALFAPARATIADGHIYLFAFLLQSVCCWLWLKDRRMGAGVAAGALLALKGYGLPLIVLAALRRDGRFLSGVGASFGCLAAIAGALLGFGQWFDFVAMHWRGGFSRIATPALQTLKGFLTFALNLPTIQSGPVRMLTPEADLVLSCVEGVLFLCLLWWVSAFTPIRQRRASEFPGSAPLGVALGICVLANLTLAPRTEEHAYPLAMSAVLLAIPALRVLRSTTVGVICGAALLAWPFHLADRTSTSGWNVWGDFARFWGAMVLMVAFICTEYSRRHKPTCAREPDGKWKGAFAAYSVALGLTLWYVKPWRDPIQHGPLLAVSRTNPSEILLLRLDLDEREVARIRIPECAIPSGIDFVRRDAVYSGCASGPMVSVVDLGKRQAREQMASSGTSSRAAFRKSAGEVWMTSGSSGKVSVYPTGRSGEVPGQIATGEGAFDVVFRTDEKRAFLGDDDGIWVVDADLRRIVGRIPGGRGLGVRGMHLTSAGTALLATNSKADTLSVIDVTSEREMYRIPVCKGPVDVAVAGNSGKELAFVSCSGSGGVGVIDLASRRQTQVIPVNGIPSGIAGNPTTGRIYVCVSTAHRVVVIEVGSPSRIMRRIKLDESYPWQIAAAY